MSEDREITIADVAQEAGVSISTVSRILNNKPDVATATREHVLNVMDELGYQPHAQAQRLAGGQSNTVALLYPVDPPEEHLIDQLHLDFMVGAATAGGEENYFLNVMTNPIGEDMILKMYRRKQVDGIILMEIHMQDWRVDLLREHGYPFVMIGRCADNDGLLYLDLDLQASVKTAFDYLIELGHREVGYLGYSAHLREHGLGPAVRAWQGYLQVVEKHHLEAYYQEPNYNRNDMYAAALSLLDQYPNLTAVVTMTDAPTAGLLEALRDSGRRLPDDFSVVGLAVDRLAELMTPTLTAIRFPAYDMGYRATKMLIRRLRGEAVLEGQQIITPELIERGSTSAIK